MVVFVDAVGAVEVQKSLDPLTGLPFTNSSGLTNVINAAFTKLVSVTHGPTCMNAEELQTQRNDEIATIFVVAAHGISEAQAQNLAEHSVYPVCEGEASNDAFSIFHARTPCGGEVSLHHHGLAGGEALVAHWLHVVQTQRSRNKTLVLIADSCYSGRLQAHVAQFDWQDLTARDCRVFIQSSCSRDEVAIGGLFAPAFCALQHADVAAWLDEKWAVWLRARTRLPAIQSPTLWCSDAGALGPHNESTLAFSVELQNRKRLRLFRSCESFQFVWSLLLLTGIISLPVCLRWRPWTKLSHPKKAPTTIITPETQQSFPEATCDASATTGVLYQWSIPQQHQVQTFKNRRTFSVLGLKLLLHMHDDVLNLFAIALIRVDAVDPLGEEYAVAVHVHFDTHAPMHTRTNATELYEVTDALPSVDSVSHVGLFWHKKLAAPNRAALWPQMLRPATSSSKGYELFDVSTDLSLPVLQRRLQYEWRNVSSDVQFHTLFATIENYCAEKFGDSANLSWSSPAQAAGEFGHDALFRSQSNLTVPLSHGTDIGLILSKYTAPQP